MIENYRSQTIVKSEVMGNNFGRVCIFKANLVIECGLTTDNGFGSELECLEEMKTFISEKIDRLKKL